MEWLLKVNKLQELILGNKGNTYSSLLAIVEIKKLKNHNN